MGSTQSRSGILIAVTAAAGAFGAAAMLSAATAPTARADDFTDVINAVEGDFTVAQTEFGIGNTDFGSADFDDGLAAYFSGLDDELIGAPNNLSLGSLELLANDAVSPSLTVTIPPITDFATGLSDAQVFLTQSGADFSAALTDLFNGNYVDAAYGDYLGSLYDAAAGQVFIEGALAALGSQ